MGNRNKPPKLTHPLLVAAAALTRATDPANPSRLTVLRLLGDAHHALQDSHHALTVIKARTSAALSNPSAHPPEPSQVDADMRFRHAHNDGARALFSVTVTALIKLPSRAGPLRRRAIDLLKLAALSTGPAAAMAAVDRLRSHISAQKRLAWSDADSPVPDFDVSAAILTLADVSICPIASRQVARESLQFLLTQRIRHKCRRGDLAHALAIIVASFPPHAPPDDRLVDHVLEYALAANALKRGISSFGTALLVAVVAPLLVNRGPAVADEVAVSASGALKVAPSPTERAMWAVSVARAVVTARRSTTYQLRKYGTSDLGSKFPKGNLASSLDSERSDADPSVWVSNEIFEEALAQVARLTDLAEGSTDASIAVASVFRMWLAALPTSLATVIPRSLFRLIPTLSAIGALSALVDAVWLGVLKHLKPSQSPIVLDGVIHLLSDSGIAVAASLSICATLLTKFGRQALRESGLSTDYNTNTSVLIKSVHDALESRACVVRLSGIRLMFAVLSVLPRTCSQFLTAVLQNMRIADMTIATKPLDQPVTSLTHYETEIAPFLGNGAALSLLVENLSSASFSVPAALHRQCAVDIMALLRPHPASGDFNSYSPLLDCVRRRVAWGLIAASAKGGNTDLFEGESLNVLLQFWVDELKIEGNRLPRSLCNSLASPSSNASSQTSLDGFLSADVHELLTQSNTRAAALYSLFQALRHAPSSHLEQAARSLVGVSAGRIIAQVSSITSSSSSSPTSVAFVGFSTESTTAEASSDKKRAMFPFLKALVSESAQLAKVIGLVPPSGDAGELCFYLLLALIEEAQRALGELDAFHTVNSSLTHGPSSSFRLSHYDGLMTNRQGSLFAFNPFISEQPSSRSQSSFLKRDKAISSNRKNDGHMKEEAAVTWLFSLSDSYSPLAEVILVNSAQAIASVISEDLSARGSLIECLSAAKLSPAVCAVVSLEVTKRLSRSDLAEINRALAVLQVLVNRALGLTGGIQKSISLQSKVGRPYTPSTWGNGQNFREEDVPGSAIRELSHVGGGLSRGRAFSEETDLVALPFHNFHTRALGIMYASRMVASEAYRELSITGGPTLWIGLVRKLIGIVRESTGGSNASQYILASNAIITLGALLEVIPEPLSGGGRHNSHSMQKARAQQSVLLKQVSEEAMDIIAGAIETGKLHIQASAALALSNRSYLVASCSERLAGALLQAWANDKGDLGPLGSLGRYAEEVHVWRVCFLHSWSDMGVKEPKDSPRFFEQDSNGIGSMSPAFAAGASSVLDACRLYWWPLSESSSHSVKELATELMQWDGNCSHLARTAGLLAMASIWSGKVDCAHAGRESTLASSIGAYTAPVDELIVPVASFSLKDSSRLSNHVGPFLDEVIYESLAPLPGGISPCELRMAATSAVSEVIRGIGVIETCTNLSRLPETLFAAIEEGTPGSQSVMEALVPRDAQKRPRYWFGLCRAVALGGERLNHGNPGLTWDVSYRTRAYAVRIAVDAIDYSMGACTCRESCSSSDSGPAEVKHTCAFGFLRKIFDFVKQVSSAASFDFESCGHGCRLLQRISARIGSIRNAFEMTDPALTEFFEMWDPCVAMMHTLLVDRVPHGVVNSAASTISELLVSSIRLRTDENSCSSQQSIETVSSYMQALMECDWRNRLLYSDQGEEVGTHVLLALIGKYGRIMSSLKIIRAENGRRSERSLLGEETAKQLFFAICGDFVFAMDENGLKALARDGGSLTAGQVSVANIGKALKSHIIPIVLGAISCINGAEDTLMLDVDIAWENKSASGVIMASQNQKTEAVPIAVLVWLLKQDVLNDLSKFRQQSFCNQMQDCLEHLFHLPFSEELGNLRCEALLCFASWNKAELLKFAERVVACGNMDSEGVELVTDVSLSILLAAVRNDLTFFQENETVSLCRGLRAVSSVVLTHTGAKGNEAIVYALKVLDVVFDMMDYESVVVPLVLCETSVQVTLCETITICLETLKEGGFIGQVRVVCARIVQRIFENGKSLNNLAMVKGSLAVAAAVSESFTDDVDDLLFNMVVEDDEARASTEIDGTNALGLSLDCYGVEECLMKYINTNTKDAKTDVIRLLLALGTVGVCKEQYSIPVALRCAEAAIVVEGENSRAINSMGMVLYSFLVLRLVEWLPIERDGAQNDASATAVECGKHFAELMEENAVSRSVLATLGEQERERVHVFLREWGEEGDKYGLTHLSKRMPPTIRTDTQ